MTEQPRPDLPYYRRLKPTGRELQVLAAVLQVGRRQASLRLGIAEATAKHTMTNLYARLGADNRDTAAIALGWLSIPAEWDLGVQAAAKPGPSDLAEQLSEAVVRYVDGVVAARYAGAQA